MTTGEGRQAGGRPFHVSVHDATPAAAAELAAIFAALGPLVGRTVSAAVVPCAAGVELSRRDRAFASLVDDGAEELLVHGWTHRRERGRGWASLLTGGADEFAGLPRADAVARLARGRDVVSDVFSRPAAGFLPPAYQLGPVDAAALVSAGCTYRLGWASAADVAGRRVRLATRIWDVSPAAWLGRLAAAVGGAAARWPGAVPTIAIHPVDVTRGFLPAALDTVRALLGAGGSPVLVADLLASRGRAP